MQSNRNKIKKQPYRILLVDDEPDVTLAFKFFFIFPDIVIFVNGIPLIIIECKSPYIPKPIEQAVEKNFERYQSRGSGYDKLIFYNHFLVATCGTLARHGTIGSNVNHYARWSEAYPLSDEDIEKICKGKPREQEILIAGMLTKSHLLDLLKNYVIYEFTNNKKIKKIAKHQQYRVVTKSVNRLKLEASSQLNKFMNVIKDQNIEDTKLLIEVGKKIQTKLKLK